MELDEFIKQIGDDYDIFKKACYRLGYNPEMVFIKLSIHRTRPSSVLTAYKIGDVLLYTKLHNGEFYDHSGDEII